MTLKPMHLLSLLCFALSTLLMSCATIPTPVNDWEPLLGKDLSNWDVFIGVPHYSVDLDGYEKGDGMEGTPVGLNNDPLNVFSVIDMEGEPVLKITGEIYGGLSTKKEYENYHLSCMVKWGEKKWEPRLEDKRDSGILYHCREPHGAFWNVWMQSQEMQVQETDCGDYYTIAGTGMDTKVVDKTQPDSKYPIYVYNPEGHYQQFKTGADGRCRRSANYEKSNDHWNHLELVCLGDKAYHIVNGHIVLVVENSVAYDENEVSTPMTKGKIQIQSEGAEVYYKDIKIRPVDSLPKGFIQ